MKFILVIVSVALAASGCATVTRGTTSQVQIRSEPAGAVVTTSLAHSCTTPCTINVNRKDEFNVLFRLPGYQDQTIEVKAIVGGAGAAGFVGNVLVGGVIGMGVDAATGSTLEHVPNPVVAMMQRSANPSRPSQRRPAGRTEVRAEATEREPAPVAPPVRLPPAPPANPGMVPDSM